MIGPRRTDYAYPLRVDGGSGQTAQTPFAAHVEQMIEQLLLTSPGERVDLPQFGCGLRQLLFAPVGEALGATLQLEVSQALQQWLGTLIQVRGVEVVTSDENAALDPGAVQVSVSYTLIETQTSEQTTVTLL